MSSTEATALSSPASELIARTILLVDDNPIQLRLVAAQLEDAGFEVTTTTSASEALDAARHAVPDAIVSDVIMDELDGFALCGMLRADSTLANVPIVLITSDVKGIQDHRVAAATGADALVQRSPDFSAEFEALRRVLSPQYLPQPALRSQPEDYVCRIAPQMSRLLSRSRTAEDRYHTLFDEASDLISVLSPEGIILEINRKWEEIMRMPRLRMIGRHIREFAAPGFEESNVRDYLSAIDTGQSSFAAIPIVGPDGNTLYIEFSNRLVNIGGEEVVLSIGRDATQNVADRQKLASSEQRYRTLVEGIPDVVWSSRPDGRLIFASNQMERVCGFTVREALAGGPEFWFSRIHPEDLPGVQKAWAALASGSYRAEYRWQHRDGQWIWLRAHASLRVDETGEQVAEGTFADITSQRRLEDQVRVSQKMEAIGQLTGGIAHDFNNMLGVVLGNAEFLLGDMTADDPRRIDVESILQAGQRAAALTRQLLTFSRHQIVEQRELDLNRIVHDLERMLRRVIGEDIQLTTVLAEDTGGVLADGGQIEQVLMNLVVNARDAMPQGGKLAIETSNVTIDEAMPIGAGLIQPGDYVMLSVSDTGCGMSPETIRRVFEPFFTTKPVGKGTGLGLSTCYGIVKRSNGYIGVYSEVGRGTTFKIYLPRTSGQMHQTPAAGKSLSNYIGGETILLVEDNEQLRSVIRRSLQSLGYTLLEAANGDQALALHAENSGCIDLIVTDVVMPGACGPDIVEQIEERGGFPKVLYMSGYTEHAALADRRLDPSLNFIQKPFSPVTIARKVRAVLDTVEVN